MEIEVDQPLATLAVKGVVKVLVVPEPPKCLSCGGSGKSFLDPQYESRFDPDCPDCDDGLARWPGEVTIRSSTKGPGLAAEMAAVRAAIETMDAYDAARLEFPPGEVLGTVTVEAAVPITGGVDEHDGDQIVWESTRVITYASKGEHFVAEGRSLADDGVTHKTGRWAPSDEFGLFDISDQLAFQDFPVGHTALILAGTDG